MLGAQAWRAAEAELAGVGDAAIGEWRTTRDHAIHLQRRLTEREMRTANLTGVLDIRGTAEHVTRVEAIRRYLPAALRNGPAERFP